MAGLLGYVTGKHDPLVAEALGIQEAFSWLKQLQVKEVVVESDSLSLITYLGSDEKIGSSVGLIIDDCKSLQKEFDLCAFSFVHRSANSATHYLAKAACSASGQECWFNDPPSVMMF